MTFTMMEYNWKAGSAADTQLGGCAFRRRLYADGKREADSNAARGVDAGNGGCLLDARAESPRDDRQYPKGTGLFFSCLFSHYSHLL
jgi:hypothetical protein